MDDYIKFVQSTLLAIEERKKTVKNEKSKLFLTDCAQLFNDVLIAYKEALKIDEEITKALSSGTKKKEIQDKAAKEREKLEADHKNKQNAHKTETNEELGMQALFASQIRSTNSQIMEARLKEAAIQAKIRIHKKNLGNLVNLHDQDAKDQDKLFQKVLQLIAETTLFSVLE